MINFRNILLIFLMNLISVAALAQTQLDSTKTYIIVKNDGAEYVGKILSEDSREIKILTRSLGEIIIPKHEIREIKELNNREINADGTLKVRELFATRYFISSNGLHLTENESYIVWNLFGPDFQIGISEDVTLGLITTWVGSPIIGSVKYAYSINEKTHLGLGSLLATGSWTAIEYIVALPYASITRGDATKNLTFSAGISMGSSGIDNTGFSDPIFSLSGMKKMNNSLTFVFDSFIYASSTDGGALILPGLRFQTQEKKAFQIGFAGVYSGGELYPAPLPFIQWFRKL